MNFSPFNTAHPCDTGFQPVQMAQVTRPDIDLTHARSLPLASRGREGIVHDVLVAKPAELS